MSSTFAYAPADERNHRLPHVVVIDEDPTVLDYLRQILVHHAHVHLLSRSEDVIGDLNDEPELDLALIDCHVGDDPGGSSALRVLANLRKRWPLVPIVMMSCSGDVQGLFRASQLGSVGFLLKPFHEGDIELLLTQHLVENKDQLESKEIPLDENYSFVRASRRMREVESQCRLVASTDIPVLVLGESGTGKEIAAMFIHKMSSRSDRSFLKVNCAAMPLDLLESELFGYEQGAFTGAVKSKPGKFELCNNGTIFLDEIGETPTALQAKLLQVLQDGSFSRLGSRSTIKVDVRVIAATNINIKEAIARKTFREDLFYRLNGFSIHLPPLRERREEIPIMAKYFMARGASKFNRDPQPFSATLMQALSSYSWPGNLRELENTVKRYLVLGREEDVINELHPGLGFGLGSSDLDGSRFTAGLKRVVRSVKGNAEAVLIAKTLESTKWNRKAAAAQLKISYKALLYKIKDYNLSPTEAA